MRGSLLHFAVLAQAGSCLTSLGRQPSVEVAVLLFEDCVGPVDLLEGVIGPRGANRLHPQLTKLLKQKLLAALAPVPPPPPRPRPVLEVTHEVPRVGALVQGLVNGPVRLLTCLGPSIKKSESKQN